MNVRMEHLIGFKPSGPCAGRKDSPHAQRPIRTSSREVLPRSCGTPRPHDGTTATGRSPGSRVAAFRPAFPGARHPVTLMDDRSPITVAGAASDDGTTPLPNSLFIPFPGTCRAAASMLAARRAQDYRCGAASTGITPMVCARARLTARIKDLIPIHHDGGAGPCPVLSYNSYPLWR